MIAAAALMAPPPGNYAAAWEAIPEPVRIIGGIVLFLLVAFAGIIASEPRRP